ncbi:tetraacyldisaccharide 4'-kinase [Cardinium endosymbiont of Culicoides punctatus]|uniref:tetraacyldisaccharide 4'-kinase n=1 Tax=Cardinium endosymbiont of Culicoides punctatus TaxID=2304601 RepID=UPI0010587892|nr:tetraacyldisaccharide 4'-kinase [Cardinium endosymbiont of Culicoides punctatus]TDG95731.1 Tetraacyldisaccharide 4'-kinase [Cardinium endosymbiont of Culicoides punctatus]
MPTLLLRTLSWCYGIVVAMRNFLYQRKIKKRTYYAKPNVIGIGNLSLGGTGKTPLVIFLLNFFSKHKVVAVLSRGYKRSSKGFKLINEVDTPLTAGDEPYLVYQRFKYNSNIVVAVCEDRVKGMEKIIMHRPDVTLVLLDDAFQHLSINPTISMLLTTFDQPFFTDHLLPLGNLREPKTGVTRADIILVTKSPKNLSKSQIRTIRSEINQYYHALDKPPIFFTHIVYNKPVLMWGNIKNQLPRSILLVTGIANPIPLRTYLESNGYSVTQLVFPDHHWFNDMDVLKISNTFSSISDKEKAIVTTEKDSVRFVHNHTKYLLKTIPTFYIPIEIGFMQTDKIVFEQTVIDHLNF